MKSPVDLKAFLLGLKKTTPFMLGLIPFGLAYGIMATQAKLSLGETLLMSLLVFAGSAQFMAVGMIKEGVGIGFIVLSTLLINLRHLLMGLSLAPFLNKLNAKWLYLLAFGLTDEVYGTTIGHYQQEGSYKGNPYFMLGSEAGIYFSWLISSLAGALLGTLIKDPLSWGLDFAMPATFLSIVIGQIKSWQILIVFLIAGILAIAGYLLIPGKWYIILATGTATVLGTILELLTEKRSTAP
ncbi:AzlC family ABC transporter permease [Carboxydothermus hydrogenoformans]|uniref:Putative branched-chain amino acid transport protein AzlC n=1 Tax=Carboxydothermus hydrogenoformans (strain ATCC BAA-161 / DSM 6008 / Z-2901) TaxID=246194 RepID=Q3AFS9_CARHZ|nr:AzlC family ABC transporter permease [Carboxydothermus hydrogenoformans]ABB14781.1 putative branched-chain amino acid transport protein AzlC [Carboxydothermus hydrogenoformans Z-2901]